MDSGVRTHLPADWLLRANRPDGIEELLQQSGVYARAQLLSAWPLSLEWHPGFEVGVLLAGEQQRFHTDLEYTLHPGDVWLNPMWEPHGWIIPEVGERSVSITFLPEFLGEETLGDHTWLSLFAVPPSQRPRVSEEARARVLALGEDLFGEVREARPRWQVAVRLNLLQLFLTLSRDWQPPAEVARRASFRDNNLLRLMPALGMLRETDRERISVTAAAAACGMSVSRFCLAFKGTMGVGFGQFTLRARAASAAHLLLWTELGVQRIATQAGFTDASHLHHTFVKLYGYAPGEYRKLVRGGSSLVAPAEGARTYYVHAPTDSAR